MERIYILRKESNSCEPENYKSEDICVSDNYERLCAKLQSLIKDKPFVEVNWSNRLAEWYNDESYFDNEGYYINDETYYITEIDLI